MKKILFALMILAVLACPVMAQRYRQHQLSIVDEFGNAVTSITSITVFNAGLSSSPTIYNDRAGTLTVTNPITTSSDNSTFDQTTGFVKWFQTAPDFKVTITDGTKTLTVDNLDEGNTRFAWYDNYIGTAASLSVGDNESITVGSDSDAVLSWVNATSILNWIPAVDGVAFNIGSTTVAKQFDFHVYVGGISGGGLTINEDTGAFTYVSASGAVSFDATGSGTFGVHTGAATGAITLGSETSGAWAVNGTSSGTLNADDSIGITTTAGGADITVNSILGRVIIEGEEDAADAVLITADGSTASTLRLFNDTGTSVTEGAYSIGALSDDGGVELRSTADLAKAVALTVDSSTTSSIWIYNDTGTSVTEGAASIELFSDDGGIELRSTANLANAVAITVDSSTTSSILLFNDTGSAATDGAASIQLESDVGAIQLLAVGSTAVTERASAIQLTATAGGVELFSGLDATNAIKLTVDGGTSSDIDIFNDTGNTADSIHLLSDLGGITITSSAGAIDIDGGSGADVTIDSTSKSIVLTATEAASDAIKLVGATGAGGITLDAGSSGITCSGDFLKSFKREIEIVTTSSNTLAVTESGKIFISSYTGTQTVILPAAAAGLIFTFIDGSSSAADDLVIDPGATDGIDRDAVGDAIESVTDAYPQSVTLIGINTDEWHTIIKVGTWGQQ